MLLDDNLHLKEGGKVHCRHCEAELGQVDGDPLAAGLRRDRPARDAGPGVHADPKHYTLREIVLRQIFCPGCHAVLSTEIVPRDEQEFRHWHLEA